MAVNQIAEVVQVSSITVIGETVSARKLSVLDNPMTENDARFLSSHCSDRKVRQGAADGLADIDYRKMVTRCSHSNYDTLAFWLAAETGYSWTINRAVFEALPHRFDQDIEKCKMSKSGGMTTDRKTGAEKPNATLARWMRLKAVCTEVVSDSEQVRADRKAKQEIEAAMIEQAVAGL